ncbi:Serine-threonine/tyrosine-protein kinase catalytic domain [Trinorchestia longiramus]|nr:Serine-threonine/tyrosine-protein kinase catalytic domain [Trinorchestia longiramus]
MEKWKITLCISVVLASLLKVAEGNTPPTVSMTRDWSVSVGEPVGTVVTRITAMDSEGDNISFSIDKSQFGKDGSHLVNIDQAGVVRVAKSLEGLGSQTFFLNVVVFDGEFRTVSGARLDVGSPRRKSGFGGLFSAMNPNSPPLGLNLPQHGTSLFRNPLGGLPPIPVPFNEPEPSGSPPLLVLPPSSRWTVSASAPLNALVATVTAHDLTNDSFFFTIKQGADLVSIDPSSGEVRVKASLKDKVGDHTVLLEVTNRHGTAGEEVLLQVLPDQIQSEKESATQDTTEVGGQEISTKPTLIAIINNGPTPPPTTRAPPREEGEPLEDNDHKTWLLLLVVLTTGIFSLAGSFLFWYCCCRTSKRRLKTKESTKKGLELTPVSSASSSLSRQESQILPTSLPPILRFWERRASENKYEEGKSPPPLPSRLISSQDSTFTSTDDLTDQWEFPRHKLKVLGILGEGCFGQVWKYEATDLKGPGSGKCFVAVKTLKESAGPQEKKDLQQELKVLKNLGKHPNVVSLLACCTNKEPTLVILEYLVNGKLQSYLRERRAQMPYDNLHGSSATLSPRDLTIFAFQVAKGMDYLSTHGIVHRDLAARNVLVGEDKICKVADFGFARDIANNHVYERKSDGRLPIRWMALESLYDNIFSSKTDVWSFGILLWEIVTLGSTPYPGMSAEEVMKKIKSGYRLEKPSYCKREMYNIMYYCWYEDPKDRPCFKELIKYLENLITSEVDYIELNKFPERSYYNINTAAASGELL